MYISAEVLVNYIIEDGVVGIIDDNVELIEVEGVVGVDVVTPIIAYLSVYCLSDPHNVKSNFPYPYTYITELSFPLFSATYR